jgi:hypothetical protein
MVHPSYYYLHNIHVYVHKRPDPSGRMVCGHLVAGVAGSNPARAWMFVTCVYMLCCPV